MKRLFDRLLPKIWTRLFLMIVTAVLLTWAVIGIALYWLGNAQALVHTFSTEHTPRLMQTTDLAAQASDLAVLSNRILYSNADTPNTFENDLRVSVDQLNQMLRDSFSTPEMQAQSLDLQRKLAGVIRSLDRARRFETTLRGQVDRLRWINVDIQDETTPLVADFSFNIAALIRGLTQENDPAERRRRAEVLMAEQALYRTFVDIGTEASIASTLAVEGSASMQKEQLKQFAGLLSDALSRLNGQLQGLPLKAEYVTLRQSIEALNQITIGQGSIVSIRRNWLEERGILSQNLEASLSGLSALQSLVQDLSADRRAQILSTSEAFEISASRTVRLLVGMTIFAALAALTILFAYIRPAIIRPLDHLTAAMRAIAEGRQPRLVVLPARNDEISQLAGAVEAFRDSVQERDRAIEQLQQTQSELVQTGKMAALGNLSAGLSHELNQPLGAIRQRLHMTGRALERGDVATAQGQTEKIDDLVARMERIISHLRRFARASEYRRDTIRILQVTDAACELLRSRLDDHGITVEIDDTLRDMTATGDFILIEQVVVNLVSNAIDAIAATSGPGVIVFRAESAAPGNVAFSVLDTGVGLGDLEPERAFDPFVTTKPPGEGLGLGLSISYNIITGMGGGLRLAHRAQGGTRATVILPKGT
ncbi:two-component system C4-dicarboxylate transport sensor histidine kinase DctB [Roseovarius halotolerans]|uniref:C4-dicarboxylate transport sensor protein DctB n=1 Tax=Roseovarius halotolerans TaxID=505353 RepID=A0A1X6ZIQ4_9RHOB|nr:ATP-binding protein [Roseovarius halotolerans]RKT30986.1 two-component system C4-dicarboxylate transport sensor histidine kinase DctB [Roseovarius halotolerans]SLN51973.1 C4-dicarboxylate transport sensor protein DctB [Roseovarius halotolerans]